MLVNEIMTRRLKTIDPGATLDEAAEKMAALDVGFLPVAEGGRQPTGIVTDRDLVIRGLGARRDPKSTHVRDIMTTMLEVVPESADIREAARLMQRRQIRRVLVEDEGHKIVGILSLGDLALALKSDKLVGEVLEMVSVPAEPQPK